MQNGWTSCHNMSSIFLYTGLRLFFLFFFLNLSWIGQLLPGESWLSLKKGNVWSVRSTNDQPIAQRCLMNHELASIYIAGAQHNVTLSDNGRTRNWTGSTAREKKKRKRSEAAWEWEFVAQQTGTSEGVERLHCNCLANVEDDSRNVPKRLRKTVMQPSCLEDELDPKVEEICV